MSDEKFIEMISKLPQFSATIKTKNAFEPILWFCVLIVPACFGMGLYLDGKPLQFFPILIALLTITIGCCSHFFLIINDPEKLQSTEYQISGTQKLDSK